MMATDTHISSSFMPSSAELACDSEPIHIPSSIQPHGLLLLFDTTSGKIVHWAGDSERLLGLPMTTFDDVNSLLGISVENLVGSCLRHRGKEPVHVDWLRPAGRKPLAIMAHLTGPFLALELLEVLDEDSAASALDRANFISHRLTTSESLDDACNTAAEIVRSISNFDSVMVYRFLDDDSGTVIAESKSPRAPAYLGHRFPASDIPLQARELYRRNPIRVIPNVAYKPIAIEPSPSGAPVDMSHCILRSVSPVHIQYLKNMGVGSSMSISLLIDGELWGLIACHHYEPRHVPVETNLLCRHIGNSLSTFITNIQLTENARLEAIHAATVDLALNSIRQSADPERQLRMSSDDLKTIVSCSGFVLLDRGFLISGSGVLPDIEQLRSLSPLIEDKLRGQLSYSTDRLSETFACDASIIPDVSGLLAIQLEGWRPLLALWLRPEQVIEIDWAGDVRSSDSRAGRAKPLTPRRSFATWREIVRGRSRPWMARETEAIEMFRMRAGFAIQQSRLTTLNAQLAEANALLNAQATTDPLTGLSNRRLFDERLSSEWARALRQKSVISLISIDIDHFKEYNDCFGHPAGDSCLRKVASSIGSSCRSVDIAARIGGEEFVLILPGIDADSATIVAERVRRRIQELNINHPNSMHGVVTVSLGVAAVRPSEGGNASELLGAIDQALYQAKASGRNSVAVST